MTSYLKKRQRKRVRDATVAFGRQRRFDVEFETLVKILEGQMRSQLFNILFPHRQNNEQFVSAIDLRKCSIFFKIETFSTGDHSWVFGGRTPEEFFKSSNKMPAYTVKKYRLSTVKDNFKF